MTSRPGPGVYTISIRLDDASQLIITVTISLNVIGALAALFFFNWTPVIGQLITIIYRLYQIDLINVSNRLNFLLN